ncbi:hypothetical protein AAFF_G00339040 [Aldrovandia affinis]|uniref:Uncharacterized protein n=1 Tax=Aldrovandia affinis TaxID=143900 RepID=A0AAD7R5W7_9TELE|nr:hypothetical protein AAFF_G00339040 [Aldrovandia affinis]
MSSGVRDADAAPLRAEAPGGPLEGEGPLGCWGTARLRCTPGREQARLCELDSVKNGWLPIHKRALVCGIPLHSQTPQEPPSQEKVNAYITITSPRGYTKRWNGNGHTEILKRKEALELFRLDFISRSRRRVRTLELRAQKRRASQNPDPLLGSTPGQRRRNCTKPHPLSASLNPVYHFKHLGQGVGTDCRKHDNPPF